jgi:ketosteroid isomerase-like protein
MSNAVERLWSAVAAGDRQRAFSELHERVVLEWPHAGKRFEGPAVCLEALDRVPGIRTARTRRVITQGHHVASEVRLQDDAGSWSVASFYTLHDGRILHAIEYWVRTP